MPRPLDLRPSGDGELALNVPVNPPFRETGPIPVLDSIADFCTTYPLPFVVRGEIVVSFRSALRLARLVAAGVIWGLDAKI